MIDNEEIFFKENFVQLKQINPVPEIHKKFGYLNKLRSDKEVEIAIFNFCKNDPYFRQSFVLAFDSLFLYHRPFPSSNFDDLIKCNSWKVMDYQSMITLLYNVGKKQFFTISEWNELKTYACNDDYYTLIVEILTRCKYVWKRLSNFILRRQLVRQISHPLNYFLQHGQRDIISYPSILEPYESGIPVFGIQTEDSITFYLYNTGSQIFFEGNKFTTEFLDTFPKPKIHMVVIGTLQYLSTNEKVLSPNIIFHKDHSQIPRVIKQSDEKNLMFTIWDYLPERIFWGETSTTQNTIRLQFLYSLFSMKEPKQLRVIESSVAHNIYDVEEYTILQMSYGKKGTIAKAISGTHGYGQSNDVVNYVITQEAFLHKMRSYLTLEETTQELPTLFNYSKRGKHGKQK